LGRTTPAPREANGDDFFLNELATGNFSSPSISNENSRARNPSRAATPLSLWHREPAGSSTNRDVQASESNVKNEPVADNNFEMPPRRTDGAAAARRGNNRRPSAPNSSPAESKKRKREEVEDDPFAEDPDEIIDLADTEKVPEALMGPKKPKAETKLSKFQCVVCMDDTSVLTVTHCGMSHSVLQSIAERGI
jgi:hypothetical protein